jgi:dTDP-4-amino-4,6-dideoxygalactose transaminase
MIPVFDITRQHNCIRQELVKAMEGVLDSGWYILGKEVEAFEKEFSEYVGTNHALGVASGTDALYIALKALDIGPGDEVITVSHTAVATVAAIIQTGATPVLIDICEDSYTMDSSQLPSALSNKTKAIIPVHLYGQAADMDPILAVAENRGIRVIEDCAQAHGALYKGKKVGSLGLMGAFSFYPTKNLGAMGDGGIIVTSEDKIACRILLLRQYGWQERYISIVSGTNSRLDEIQAAILRVKLKHLDIWNKKRRALAELYGHQLFQVRKPMELAERVHVYHLYVVASPWRNELMGYLKDRGIITAIHYPVPVHLQKAYSKLIRCGKLPVTERICSQIISLPMYPELTAGEIRKISNSINEFYEGKDGHKFQ